MSDPQSSPLDQVWSERYHELMRYPYPLVFGVPKTVDTYYTLEMLERGVGLTTLSNHGLESQLWYIGLRLLHDPMLGSWDFPDYAQVDPARSAFLVQSAILGLSVSTSKAAFDQLIRGNYSIAFASIRHMLESAIQSHYLMIHPGESTCWTEAGKKTPGVASMLKKLIQKGEETLAAIGETFDPEPLQALYDAWSLMSKGSHPTGGGLSQVTPKPEDEMHRVGAVYRAQLAYVGFDNGLFALRNLYDVMSLIRNPGSDWNADVMSWGGEVAKWRRTLATKQVLEDSIPAARREEVLRRLALEAEDD